MSLQGTQVAHQPRTDAQKLEEMHGDEYRLEAILIKSVHNHSERVRVVQARGPGDAEAALHQH